MSALAPQVFDFFGIDLRAVQDDSGDIWFVSADVAAALKYPSPSQATRILDRDMKGVQILHTSGGDQRVSVITQGGLWRLIMRSQREEARKLERMVVDVILPTIHRTGSYSLPGREVAIPQQRQPETTALPSPRELAQMVIDAEDAKAALEAQVAELEPAAAAWNEVATAEGSVLVGDAAKMLHHAGIDTGPVRLFKQMEALGWVYRSHSPDTDTYGPWKAKQDQIECGRLLEVPVTFFNRKANARQVGAPQIRVTMKGVEKLHDLMGRKRLALPAN